MLLTMLMMMLSYGRDGVNFPDANYMTFAFNKVLSQPDIWDLRGISIQLGE